MADRPSSIDNLVRNTPADPTPDPSTPERPAHGTSSRYDPAIFEPTRPVFSVVLSPEQVARLAYKAGFRGKDLIRMVAIAGRESGYDTGAWNGENRDRSVGLWQINMKAHGERFGTRDALHDPWVNAQAAFALYSEAGGSMRPWTTYDGTIANGTSTFYKRAEEAVTSQGLDQEGVFVGLDDIPVSELVNESPVGSEFPGIPNTGDGISDAETVSIVAEEFPQYVAYLEIPELRDILVQAANEGRDASWLRYQLENTDWWKNTDATRRSMLLTKRTDPASYKAGVRDFAKKVRGAYIAAGLKPPEGDPFGDLSENDPLFRVSEGYRLAGLTEQDLSRSLALASSYDPANPSGVGSIADAVAGVRQMAASYMITLSDEEAYKFAQQSVAGELSSSAISDYFRDVAVNRFSYDEQIATRIKQGFTPEQLFSANRDEIAKVLEIDKDQIDWGSQKFAKILDGVDSSGRRRPMTVPETRAYLRSLPEAKETRAYQRDAADIAVQLGREFGYL